MPSQITTQVMQAIMEITTQVQQAIMEITTLRLQPMRVHRAITEPITVWLGCMRMEAKTAPAHVTQSTTGNAVARANPCQQASIRKQRRTLASGLLYSLITLLAMCRRIHAMALAMRSITAHGRLEGILIQCPLGTY